MSWAPGTSERGQGTACRGEGRMCIEAVHFPHAGSLGEKADKPSLRLARLQGTMSPPGEAGCQEGALVRPVPNTQNASPGAAYRSWGLLLCLRGTSIFRANGSQVTERQRDGLILLKLNHRPMGKDRTLQSGLAGVINAQGRWRSRRSHPLASCL